MTLHFHEDPVEPYTLMQANYKIVHALRSVFVHVVSYFYTIIREKML